MTQKAESKSKLGFEDFLQQAREVTQNYKIAWGKWSDSDQWKKIREEEKEFKDATNNINELEEFWDCFFAKLTLLHLQEIDDYAILESAKSTLNKIWQRSCKVKYDEIRKRDAL